MTRTNLLGNLCLMCRKPVPQPRTGRTRLNCSNACRQRSYRRSHGIYPRRRRKPVTPPMERRVGPAWIRPIHQSAPYLAYYRCVVCGEVFEVSRLRSEKPRQTCSDRCTQKLRHTRRRFEAAMHRADVEGHLNDTVFVRHTEGKLSPLCARCGQPFPPLFGPGRPRKYCSKRCCDAASEERYRIAHGRKRRHRYRACAGCGQRIDRTDSTGRLTRRYCTEACRERHRTRLRTRRARQARLRAEQIRLAKIVRKWRRLARPRRGKPRPLPHD